MDGNLSSQVARCIDVHQRKRRGRQVLTVLAAIVVFCTVYALMMPAVTMSNQVTCGLEAHVHSEDCWTVELSGPRPELVCDAMDYSGVVIHKHNSFCYDEYGELICTLPETELHVHDKSCYQEQRELICQERQEVGHVHDASCWAYDRGELICTEAEGEDAHTHTDDCYQTESRQVLTCTLPEEEPHTHDDSCYTTHTRQELTCGLAESDDKLDAEGNVVESGHHHDDSCYTEVEERELSCTREETEGHHHDESCYTTEEVRTLICGHTETSGHEHGKECYEWTQRLVCQEEEREAGHVHTDDCYQITEVLACQKQEVMLHTHTEACYDENGTLTCGKSEIVEHQHTAACLNTPEGEPEPIWVLTCEKEEHTHSDKCYMKIRPEEGPEYYCGQEEHLHTAECCFEDGGLKCTLTEHLHTEECLQPKLPTMMSVWADGAATLEASLLYGDQKEQNAYPDGFEYYATSTMSGYIKLEPRGLTEDLEDVTVTLAIPKEYVEKDSVTIPSFNSNSTVTEYEIIPVEEEGENYCVKVHFGKYDKTQTLVLPFALSFLDKVVPSNYTLPVTASVSCGDSTITTEPNIYKPKYKDWEIDKFVNSNKLDTFKEDGVQVVVTAQEADGNPYLDDRTYVSFAFRVNRVIRPDSDLNDYRDATSVTLTDTLPTYEDTNGNTRTAAFDADVNPGWTLSEDGTTVSKTYTGANSPDVLNQIYNDAPLKLRFPECAFEGENGKLSVSLNNEVDLVAKPSNPGDGEPDITANDPLRFVMTTEAGTKGSFTKVAEKGKIYDTDTYKTNPYPWRVRLFNNGAQPLEHIQIQDRKIVENGRVEVPGMDEALKFVKLESDLGDSVSKTGRTFADMVDRVAAYYTDGTTQEYSISSGDIDDKGNFTIEFDSSRVCDGYEIIFKDDFKLEMTEAVSFKAYTVYRDPENTHVPEGQESVRYENTARSVNTYMQGGQPVNSYLTVTHGYDMLPVTENLAIEKQTYANSATENNMVGDVYRYWISLAGSLAKEKEYEPIYIVDLLPNEVDFVEVTHGKEMFDGGSVTPKQVENYHNSGRTALIWELPYDALMRHLEDSKHNSLYYVCIQFSVRIREDAHPGTITNNIYLVGDNLEEYTGKTGGAVDIYDLDNDGSTEDMIAWGNSDATIMTAASAYAEKFIAPAGSDNWSRQGLNMTAGTDFDYLLKVTNEIEDQTGLVVYDTLPANGDRGVFGEKQRNSEFPVRLREAITPPEGYTAWYTVSEDVYGSGMSAMVDRTNIWMAADAVTDWSAVTAFKLVADEGVKLTKGTPFQVRVPACVTDKLDVAQLSGKTYEDTASGTVAYLQANNNFGFQTAEHKDTKEANTVWARIPFAGFTVKKLDCETEEALEGAEFTLYDSDGAVVQSAVSGEDGLLKFSGLTEGTYTLTETEAPAGYFDDGVSLTVTITQNAATMEYSVAFSGSEDLAGTGTNATPLLVKNAKNNFTLPETGGSGTVPYALAGGLLITAALWLWYRKKTAEGRGADTT